MGRESVNSNTEWAHDGARVDLKKPGTDTDLKPRPDAPVKLEDVAGDLREVRWMVEFLVRREKKVDVKTAWPVSWLGRLEKEDGEFEDAKREVSLTKAPSDKTTSRSWSSTRGSSTRASAVAASRLAGSSSSTPASCEAPKSSRSAQTHGCRS